MAQLNASDLSPLITQTVIEDIVFSYDRHTTTSTYTSGSYKISLESPVSNINEVELLRASVPLTRYNLYNGMESLFSPNLSITPGLYNTMSEICTQLSDSNWDFSYNSDTLKVTVTNNSGSSSSINDITTKEHQILAYILGISSSNAGTSIANGSSLTFDYTAEPYPFFNLYLLVQPLLRRSTESRLSYTYIDEFSFQIPLYGSLNSRQWYEPFKSQIVQFYEQVPVVTDWVFHFVDEWGDNVEFDGLSWSVTLRVKRKQE